MNARFFSSTLSLLILFTSAELASAQNNLLFTFDDSGPNVTATVTGLFDVTGLSFSGTTSPTQPQAVLGASANFLTLGTTTVGSIDLYDGANAPGPNAFGQSFLAGFPTNAPGGNFPEIITPLSEYLQIEAFLSAPFTSNAIIGLAQGQTVFDADALANNVIVFDASSIEDLGSTAYVGDSSFLSTTPFTVLSDSSGENTVQFVLAVPEPSSTSLLLASSAGIAFLRRRK